MGPLALLAQLPLLPVRGVVRLTEIIYDQATQELHDPAKIRRELEEAEEARSAGEISGEQVEKVEQNAINRLYPGSPEA
jgi:hypothetical protein